MISGHYATRMRATSSLSTAVLLFRHADSHHRDISAALRPYIVFSATACLYVASDGATGSVLLLPVMSVCRC